MTEIKKYKGRVKTTTLHRILSTGDVKNTYVGKGVLYRTDKNTFFATPHGTQYADIFIVFGRDDSQ